MDADLWNAIRIYLVHAIIFYVIFAFPKHLPVYRV